MNLALWMDTVAWVGYELENLKSDYLHHIVK